MARPPRGRIPGKTGSGDEAGADELPLDLPRLDPVRPRAPRTTPRVEPSIGDRDGETASRLKAPLRPALRASDPPNVESPREIIRNPFDYYAMPRDGSDSLSRPITKPTAPQSSEFLTSKYYTPRSELTATRNINPVADHTDSWASSVRPGRSILDLPPERDEEPDHLRHLPSRVRDHLRAEPRTPSVSEPLNSFTNPTAPLPKKYPSRTRPTVPLPLAPELRAPVPQEIRVSRQMSEPAQMSHQADWSDEKLAQLLPRETDFDEQSDITSTDDVPGSRPIIGDPKIADHAVREQARPGPNSIPSQQFEASYSDYDGDKYEEGDGVDHSKELLSIYDPEPFVQSDTATWSGRVEAVVSPLMATSDWDEDQAMHALTSRLRNRAIETREQLNSPRGEALNKMRNALGAVGGQVLDTTSVFAKIGSSVQQKLQSRAQKDANARASLKNAEHGKVQSDELHAVPLASIQYDAHVSEIDYSAADQTDFMRQSARPKFWQRRPQAPVRASTEFHRASRRQLQSRLYEDIVAWIVVPPFIIGAIYGGLELAKFLSNSPLGKMLSGQ